jgi:PPK2 family polyphosphate:nucleotide phosphotransferase
MSLVVEPFRVREGRRVDLKKRPTRVEPFYASKDDYRSMLAEHVERLAERQELLYAHDRYSLLLIFQAMDAAGKDGVIKHVMSGINPQGCQVFSFKHPSATDLDHDFLWRTTMCLPERGRIGIFNRSYYEEVLIVRVHPEILRAQRLPEDAFSGRGIWKARHTSIVDHERHLHRSGTRIVKFFLHISPEEQRQRFLARIDDPNKKWKFSAGDVAERARWKDYMRAYEDCLSATSTDHAPWYVVPADDKPNARLIVSQVVLDTINALKMRYPAATPERIKELRRLRRQLMTP